MPSRKSSPLKSGKTSQSAKPAGKKFTSAKPALARNKNRSAKKSESKDVKTTKDSLASKKSAAHSSDAANKAQARVLNSKTVFAGRLFRVVRDTIVEPTGVRADRDVVRHNGSAVILAVDSSTSKTDPWVVMERQYRHAARRFLWEVPAGKLEPGEDPLTGAKRELAEETGYRAKKWKQLAEYWPSPGFVGEAMLLFLAEDLSVGDTNPDEDERIEMRLIKLSEILGMIEKGEIHDGKTLNAVLLYVWLNGLKRKK